MSVIHTSAGTYFLLQGVSRHGLYTVKTMVLKVEIYTSRSEIILCLKRNFKKLNFTLARVNNSTLSGVQGGKFRYRFEIIRSIRSLSLKFPLLFLQCTSYTVRTMVDI